MATTTVIRKVGKFDRIRSIAVQQTARHFNVHESTVRKVDAGDRVNAEILKYYRSLYLKLSADLPELAKA